MLPIIRPDISLAEVAADVEEILSSGTLTSGPYVARFEAELAAALGATYAVATTSATTALHLSLAAAGIGPGDEVLVSDFTFPASGNVIAERGAVPVLVDSSANSFALDVTDAAAKVTSRTRAVLPVDPFGQPADLAAVERLALRHGLSVVEDAACGLGAALDDRPCGAWAGLTCFSFHPRKVVTTGEGGAVVTSDPELAERLVLLRNHGGVRASVGLEFVEHGFNYRLSEIPAALGLAQLRRLDEILADRRRTAARYEERLEHVAELELRRPGPREVWSYQSFVVLLEDAVDRDEVIARMRAAGIETTLGTYAMHAHPAFARYGYRPGDLPNSWRAQRQSLTLPLLPRMSEGDVDRVVSTLEEVLVGVTRTASRG
ncbi:MAG: DegT/DnrJ/EryC1/StrS family aminotransferase [Acidimicrobiia bacterium]